MWEYAEAGRQLTMECVTATNCIYCRTPLARLPAKKFEAGERTLLVQFSLCMVCGWWTVYRVHQGDIPRSREAESYSGSIGCLKELDLKDVSIPLGEVRKYIAAKKEKVYEVDPDVFEDIVGSVFQDYGYRVLGHRSATFPAKRAMTGLMSSWSRRKERSASRSGGTRRVSGSKRTLSAPWPVRCCSGNTRKGFS